MSFNDVYSYVQGEYQQVERVRQEPVSNADITFFKDLNLVKWGGYNIELWSAETGGVLLVQGIDYSIELRDNAVQGPTGEAVYAGYSLLTPSYYGFPLWLTADIVGAYTTRPYRPSYDVVTADATVTPVSMDDSVIADASAGNFTITLADGFHLNQRYSVVCKGTGTVTVVGTGIGAGAAFQGVGVSWLWDGGEWMPLAVPGAREGGFYYDYVPAFIRPDVDPISATIPNFLATYGEGFFYVGLEFTYNGVTDKTNGTFAIADDGIDKYAVLAVDVAGGDSTLSIQWQWATDTMVAIETGTDFTDLNLWAVYRWEKVTYGGYGAFGNTVEAPTYGEAIVTGQELFLDGTKELVSSDNRQPVVDVVKYLPANGYVDGIPYPEANSKWPGQRGTYGFFGEYENAVASATRSATNATVTNEGGWIKVLADATSACVDRYDFTAFATTGYTSVLMRKGTAPVSVVGLSTEYAEITWATQSIAFMASSTDAGSVWIDDDTLLLKMYKNVVGQAQVALYASALASIVGEYTYYKDVMAVDLPYAVPYAEGVSPACKYQFDYDWATSAEWTIQGWFIGLDNGAASEYVFGNRPSGGYGFAFLWSGGNQAYQLYSFGDTTQLISATDIVSKELNHYKILLTSATSISITINGGTPQEITTDVIDVALLLKYFFIGSDPAGTGQMHGYQQDWTIQPGIDTSDAHYLSGLPYFSSDKTYGKNASWSIDSVGNISGNSQMAGVIIQDEEIDGQWVTRWDTGRMEIRLTTPFTTLTNSFVGFFGTTSGTMYYLDKIIVFAVPFVGTVYGLASSNGPACNVQVTSETEINIREYNRNNLDTIFSRVIVTGQWK